MNKVISILLTVSLLISSSITVFAENTSISSDGEVNIPWNLENVGTSEDVSPVEIGEVLSEDIRNRLMNLLNMNLLYMKKR